MILDDLGEYEKADERLLEARSGYVTAFSKEHLPKPNSQCGRTLLSFVAGEGHEDIVKLLLETVDPDVKDRKSSRTPLSRAAKNGHEAVVKLLLETGKSVLRDDIRDVLMVYLDHDHGANISTNSRARDVETMRPPLRLMKSKQEKKVAKRSCTIQPSFLPSKSW
ncbi:hypothetical protein ACEPPN_015209 [Leptodophora sp. 'Broadleaf-Isolate-01']